MTRQEIAYAVILGLLVNEVTDICPWLAIRLIRWAARLRYPDAPERAASRSEELAALINDRPGKLSKLLTAVGFALHAAVVVGLRSAPRDVRWLGASAIRFANDHRAGVRRVYEGTLAAGFVATASTHGAMKVAMLVALAVVLLSVIAVVCTPLDYTWKENFRVMIWVLGRSIAVDVGSMVGVTVEYSAAGGVGPGVAGGVVGLATAVALAVAVSIDWAALGPVKWALNR